MTLPVEALELEILRLCASERARLLDRVVASLDAEIERGGSSPVSGPEALARLRAELA